MTEQTERKSRLAEAIDRKPKKDHGPHDLPAGFVTHADVDVAQVIVRVLVKKEEDAALIAAHKMVKDLIYEGAETALGDSDLLNDNKTIYALFKAMRDADDPMYTAFFDQEWMREKFSTDKIQHLLNLYFSCREQEEVMRWNIDSDELEMKLDAVADADQDSSLPRALISDCTDTWLRQAFILCALRIRSERRALYRTRQLLAMAVKYVMQAPITEDNARELDCWGTAARGELAADEPWGTSTIVEQGWIGLERISYDDVRNVLAALCEAARDKAPPMTQEEEAALDAAIAASEEDPDEQEEAPKTATPDGAILMEDEDD